MPCFGFYLDAGSGIWWASLALSLCQVLIDAVQSSLSILAQDGEQHHRLKLFNIISMNMKTLLVYGDCIWFMKCMLYDNVCYAGVYIYVYVQSKGQKLDVC